MWANVSDFFLVMHPNASLTPVANHLHPQNKVAIGERLANMMSNVSYGIDSGPYQAPIPIVSADNTSNYCLRSAKSKRTAKSDSLCRYANCDGSQGMTLVLKYLYEEYGMVSNTIENGVVQRETRSCILLSRVGFEALRPNGLWYAATSTKVQNGNVVLADFAGYPTNQVMAWRYGIDTQTFFFFWKF